MSENDVDIESKILQYIDERNFVRTEQVIDEFARGYRKKSGSNGADETDNKKSRRTIERILEKMTKKEGPLVSLNKEQVKRYGIEENDGRARYLALEKTVARERHLDKVFDLFCEGSDIDKKMVINEISGYKWRYLLFPSQLDVLVLSLDSEDTELIHDLLNFLHGYIIYRGIRPENETIFLEKLRNLLKRYEEGHEKYTSLRYKIILLLGYYKDKAVIEQLKKDIEAGRLQKHENEYCNEFVSKVIEESRTELFFLENKLRKEGNVETADELKRIRVLAVSEVEKSINQGTY